MTKTKVLDDGTTVRLCQRCKEWKLIGEFVLNTHHALGRGYECRPCRRDYQRSKRAAAREQSILARDARDRMEAIRREFALRE